MDVIANFSVNYLQCLNADSQATADFPACAKDPELLKQFYANMVLTRMFDDKIIKLQRTGKMGTYPSSLGQEAIGTGVAHAMQTKDIYVPYYRDQAARLLRGVSLVENLLYWSGDERGSNFANAKQDLPTNIPIATQLNHAAGIAYAIKLRKQKRVVVTSTGDGGTSEGDFYTAINVAGDWQLPIVFVVNNNQWAISVPRSAQTAATSIAQKAIGAGFDGIQVDGNDVIAVHKATTEAVDKARKGGGPTLIEALSYRLCDHTTADDASRYQPSAELKQAWKLEPIMRLQRYLKANKHWNEKQQQRLEQQCEQQIEDALAEFNAMPPQPATSIFDSLFATLPDAYQPQRKEVACHK